MKAFNPEGESFYNELQSNYIKKLNDGGVESPVEYLERLDLFDGDTITEPNRVKEELTRGDYPLEVFFQVAPVRDQEVMIASLNPGMQNSIDTSTFTQGEYRRLADAGKDVEAKASVVAANLDKFLTGSTNQFSDLIQILREELNLLDDSVPYESYVDSSLEDPLDGFFEEVCYACPFRLATPKDTGVSKLGSPDRAFARRNFEREIFEVVDPTVLVSTGKRGWVAVWEYLDREYSESPEELIESYSQNVPTVKSYNSEYGVGAYAGLFRVPVEDLWVITTWHASHWIKSDRLRENARMLNQELKD